MNVVQLKSNCISEINTFVCFTLVFTQHKIDCFGQFCHNHNKCRIYPNTISIIKLIDITWFNMKQDYNIWSLMKNFPAKAITDRQSNTVPVGLAKYFSGKKKSPAASAAKRLYIPVELRK